MVQYGQGRNRVSALAGARSSFLGGRAAVLRAVRAWFDEGGFIEVETPVRVATPALEDYIDAEVSGEAYLRTSPELHMKRLLCEGMAQIYQMGPCFRQGEVGRLHSSEFTMLEWYRAPGDCWAILDDTVELLRRVSKALGDRDSSGVDWAGDWERVTVSQAFERWAGWDPVAEFDQDRFDLDLVNKVEPALARDRPVVMCDYPKEAAALAEVSERGGRLVAERWELYAGGMELANAYSELTDAGEQRKRFEACAALRKSEGREAYPLDEPFLAALESGLPVCGGIALGVDRLVMLMHGAESITDVRPFCREVHGSVDEGQSG
jgi:lysyl-tRNA synthetase class 2